MNSGRPLLQSIEHPPSPVAAGAASGVGRSLLDDLLTSRQVAEILQMKVSTIEDYARRGILPSVKVGRHRRFIRSQLEQAVGSLSVAQGSGRLGVARTR